MGMFLLVVLFLFFLFRNLNDSVSRYAACWLCFDFVTVGFAYIYGSKGLRHQALMTSLNGVRFSFNCSMKGFWWVTFFLPILMAVGMGTVFFISTKMLHANSSSSVIISMVLMAIVGIVSIGIFNGTLYSLVMSFL